jgi:hypothetical protein
MAVAKIVLKNAYVKIGNLDVSSHCNQVTLTTSVNEVETTAFGTSGHVTRVGGLQDSSVSLTFHQDFVPAQIDAVVSGLLGSLATVVVAPNGSAVGSANPHYTCEVLVTEWGWEGGVGELATKGVTWPANAVTRATA